MSKPAVELARVGRGPLPAPSHRRSSGLRRHRAAGPGEFRRARTPRNPTGRPRRETARCRGARRRSVDRCEHGNEPVLPARQVDKMTTIGQRRRLDMPQLAPRAIDLGDRSHRAVSTLTSETAPVGPGAKRMTSALIHVPVASCTASQTTRAEPPASWIIFSLPSAKKPIDLPSGDQNGPLPSLVAGSIRAAPVSSGRCQMARRPSRGSQAEKTMCRLSGEIAGDSFRMIHSSGRSMTKLASSGTGLALASRLKHGRDAHQEQTGRRHANPDSRAARPPCRRVLADDGARGVAAASAAGSGCAGATSSTTSPAVGLDRHEQSIAAAWNGLDESRRVR